MPKVRASINRKRIFDRRLRSSELVAKDMQVVEKPAKRARSAISTIERGPAGKFRCDPEVNAGNMTKGEIGATCHGGSSLSAATNSVPNVAAITSVQSIPADKNSETLDTLVATNALLAEQLNVTNESFQQLEQKYIRALEQLYVERLGGLELKTKMDEQRCIIEKLEMKIVQHENTAFCDDLIQLDGTRKKSSY